MRLENAERRGVVAVDPLGPLGVDASSRLQFGWLFLLVRAGRNCGSSMAAVASLPRLFVLRDDQKFLRHVKWSLGPSE